MFGMCISSLQKLRARLQRHRCLLLIPINERNQLWSIGATSQSSLRMDCTCRVNTFYTLLSNKLLSLVYACISIKLIQKEPHTIMTLRTGPRPRWMGLMERLPEQQVRLSQTLQMQAFSLIYRRKLNQILPGLHHKGRRVVNIRTRFQVLLMLRCVQTYGRLRVS